MTSPLVTRLRDCIRTYGDRNVIDAATSLGLLDDDLDELVGYYCRANKRLYMNRGEGGSFHEGQSCCEPIVVERKW